MIYKINSDKIELLHWLVSLSCSWGLYHINSIVFAEATLQEETGTLYLKTTQRPLPLSVPKTLMTSQASLPGMPQQQQRLAAFSLNRNRNRLSKVSKVQVWQVSGMP